jgi:AcrR family transcriptional regulator
MPEQRSRLPRLPPGRHGLPREYVSRNQRERLLAGVIAAVSEKGFHETTITEIAAAAGVSRRTFYAYFDSKEECFVSAFEEICAHLRTAAAAAAAVRGEWSEKVAARLGAALEAFAANPRLAVVTLIVPPRAGGSIAALQRDALDAALELLTEGMPASPAPDPPSRIARQALIGGVVALIVDQVEAGGGEALGERLPEAAELFLTPFVGREQAIRAASAPSSAA